VTRAHLPALGYLYVALTLPALILGGTDLRASSALLTAGGLAYFWFLAGVSWRLMRYQPDGFYTSAVMFGGAAYFVLQTLAVVGAETVWAGPASGCAATVIMAASLAAWKARKIPRWFGQAGVAGGVAEAAVGFVESGADWKLASHSVFASSLGFMIWVIVTATYLLRR
jgi:hypothetical protein